MSLSSDMGLMHRVQLARSQHGSSFEAPFWCMSLQPLQAPATRYIADCTSTLAGHGRAQMAPISRTRMIASVCLSDLSWFSCSSGAKGSLDRPCHLPAANGWCHLSDRSCFLRSCQSLPTLGPKAGTLLPIVVYGWSFHCLMGTPLTSAPCLHSALLLLSSSVICCLCMFCGMFQSPANLLRCCILTPAHSGERRNLLQESC